MFDKAPVLTFERVTEVSAGELGLISEFLLNTQKLVVLGQTFASTRGSGLYLMTTNKDVHMRRFTRERSHEEVHMRRFI